MGTQPAFQRGRIDGCGVSRRIDKRTPQRDDVGIVATCRLQRGRARGEAVALAGHAPGFIDRRQVGADASKVDALRLLHLLDQAQRPVGIRQGLVRVALAQFAFGLPHLVERLFQDGAGLRIEQGGRFGMVVGMAVCGQHVAGVAEHRRLRVAGIAVFVVVAVVGRDRRIGGRLVVGRWRLRAAFGFLAEELAVAQAQDALVDADGVGTLEVGVGIQRAPLFQQRLGIDDDLPLAAEIGRHHLLDRGFQVAALHVLCAGQAQDQAGAVRFLRLWIAVVVHA